MSDFRCLSTNLVSNGTSPDKLWFDFDNVNGPDDALSIYKMMIKMKPLPSIRPFNSPLSRIVKLKDYSVSVYIFKDISNLGVPVNIYTLNMVINCSCNSHRVNFEFSMLGVFFKLDHMPDESTFSPLLKVVINGLCKVINTTMAIQLLRVMEKGSCRPDTHKYNMIIDGLCKDRMIDSAMKLFDKMPQKGINRNVITYNVLINGLSNEARKVYNSLPGKGIIPCSISYVILINGYFKEMKIDEAMHLFRQMPFKGLVPYVSTYTTVMQGLFRLRKCSTALLIFDEMQAAGQKPNFRT
ncbi:hypothetical protein BUALT_Bualt12G0032000 [Buddleja alternifolia]|uniref:Pentatricopeptide repeat-containing protein n=1 Tax=Buddleja alternifolia TaxID=168488 RepID=A0AAV6WVJ0_9LAMI|nr:hypothetical protein BUALT_Bualt12G0032000 [Buddleja alternifolia]